MPLSDWHNLYNYGLGASGYHSVSSLAAGIQVNATEIMTVRISASLGGANNSTVAANITEDFTLSNLTTNLKQFPS